MDGLIAICNAVCICEIIICIINVLDAQGVRLTLNGPNPILLRSDNIFWLAKSKCTEI